MTEIAHLLTPISDNEPSGSYLKLDRTAYRSLRNVYNSAQSSFRQLVETPDASSDPAIVDANTENWAELRKISEETLTSQSKDLEILGWYITSQLFTSQPFHNLATAIPALNLFINQFWDTLNPMLPDAKLKASDDAGKAKEITEFRAKSLLQLVGESLDSSSLYIPFQMLDFCSGVTFGDYLTAERKGNIAELKESALNAFDQSVAETLFHLASIYSDLEMAEKNLAEKCQAVSASVISFNFIKTNVRDLIKAIHFLVGEKFAPWPLDDNFHVIQSSTETREQSDSIPSASEQTVAVKNEPISATGTGHNSEPVNQGNGSVVDNGQVQSSNGHPSQTQTQAIVQNVSSINGIVNRDHAFQEIRKIAEYFKETEPHSPIAFLLERSIRWGYMSFPELLQEMIGNEQSVIAQINQMTGMDNLDKLDLSGKPVPVITSAPEFAPVSKPTIEEPTKVTPIPISPNSTADTNQASESTSNSSSSSMQDFEW
ncbi:ImpA family type VI secretion system protein [Vibrio tasmaniensis]|uniref:type VI secretion system protein TssA n=1 Tax=Vibrio tasmaniensis TaxID=212663 RepID=UPI00107FBDD6|nr:type VI secretion system ImpA family N-terminal domain-containing protein [Vibrio tasmaniensis]